MDTSTKKILELLRRLSWYWDYFFFLVSRIFFYRKKFPSSFQHILVIELDKIGDVIVTTPTIRALHLHYNALVDVMVQPNVQETLVGNPHVHNILPYGRKEIHENYKQIVEEIRGKYDLAVLLHPGSREVSKLLKDAGIPYRVGCTKPMFFGGKGFYLHRKTKPTFTIKHKIHDNLDVIKTTLGINAQDDFYEVHVTSEAISFIQSILSHSNIKKPYVVIHVAPEYVSHCWNTERFAQVADTIIERYDVAVVFSGDSKDKDYNQEVIDQMHYPAHNLAGATSIQQFFAIIKGSSFVISIDTSAMHIAAALKIPVVALFGEGYPKVWRPYAENSAVIFKEEGKCKNCSRWLGSDKVKHSCMDIIQVEEVLDAISTLWKH